MKNKIKVLAKKVVKYTFEMICFVSCVVIFLFILISLSDIPKKVAEIRSKEEAKEAQIKKVSFSGGTLSYDIVNIEGIEYLLYCVKDDKGLKLWHVCPRK